MQQLPVNTNYYIAIVKYKDDNNMSLNEVYYGTTTSPIIGQKIVVSKIFGKNKVIEKEKNKDPLILLGDLFCTILFCISLFMTCYSLNISNNISRKIVLIIFILFFFIELSVLIFT